MLKPIADIRIQPLSWLKAAIYTCTMVLVYYSTLQWLIFNDWMREDYNYCIFIPFIVLFLIWEKRKELIAAPSSISYSGFAPVAMGILFFGIGELSSELFTQYLSLWFVLVGLIWVHMGWKKIKMLVFPLVVALAMFPFPVLINNKLNFQLRLISSKLGVEVLHLFGMLALREGNVIDLGFTKLQVVDACSGLNYTTSLMLLALLLAHWFDDRMWKRIVLFLSSIPLAILFNSFRIATIAVIFRFFGDEVAEGFLHGFSGWIIFICAIPLLLLEMAVLRRLPPRGKKDFDLSQSHKEHRDILVDKEEAKDSHLSQSQGVTEDRRQEPEVGDQKSEVIVHDLQFTKIHSPFTIRHSLISPVFLISMTILLLTFVLSHSIEFREKVPARKSFSTFPLHVASWSGQSSEMEAAVIDTLDLNDYTLINYKDPAGRVVNFYVAYYESQSKGKSIHSPETCLPGSGWEFKEAQTINLPLNDKGSSMLINRTFMEKNWDKQLVYFWFPCRGRTLTNAYQMKLYNFWDALTKHRTDGALVRVITPVYDGEEAKDADERLAGFVSQISPVLSGYLPQ
jgi:EpsI family protein